MLVALLSSLASAQECPEPGLDMIRRGTEALWEAYARVDIKAFDAASVVINEGIACADTRLESHTVVELHRTMAIIAFAAGQQTPARKSFLAARTLDPSWVLPPDLYPENHPLRTIYESAVPAASGLEKLDASRADWLVDGLPAAVVPLDRAFVLQALDDEGKVRYTGYLWSIIDIPNLQLSEGTGLHTSVVRVGASALGGVLAARQTAGELDGYPDRSDTAPVAGGELRARVEPLRFAGLDLRATGLLNADAAVGGGLGMEARASLLLGWELRSEERRIRLGLRPGVGYEVVRGWTGSAAEPVTTPFAAPTFAVGAETRIATEGDAFDVIVDPTFLATGTLWQLRLEGTWTHALTDLLALEAGVLVAPGLGAYEIVDTRSGALIAGRRDTAVRGGLGIVVYR